MSKTLFEISPDGKSLIYNGLMTFSQRLLMRAINGEELSNKQREELRYMIEADILYQIPSANRQQAARELEDLTKPRTAVRNAIQMAAGPGADEGTEPPTNTPSLRPQPAAKPKNTMSRSGWAYMPKFNILGYSTITLKADFPEREILIQLIQNPEMPLTAEQEHQCVDVIIPELRDQCFHPTQRTAFESSLELFPQNVRYAYKTGDKAGLQPLKKTGAAPDVTGP